MKNINDAYVDVITGHLHVTLNELFNAKANLTVLDLELQNANVLLQNFAKKQQEDAATITEQIERIRELESIRDKLKIESDSKTLESSKAETLQNKVNEFANRITEYKTTVSNKDDEITKLTEDLTLLIDENRMLKEEFEKLKAANNQTKKLKK